MVPEGGDERIWRDDPISSFAEDTLGRGHVAKRAADLIIESHSWDSSVVLGLTGPWGSGKSSVLALTVKALQDVGSEWKVVRFTPWAAGDLNGLLADFYSALAAALPEKKFEPFKSRLADVIEVSSPATVLIPGVGGVAKGSAQWFSKWLRRQKPWAQAFSEASRTLKNLHTPVLVVADDIDRLQGDELLSFLKVVRLLGRFPGISYLLAYDEASLKQTIASVADGVNGAGTSHDFLEKFVQFPIYLPPLLPGQALRQIDIALGDAFAGTQHTIAQNDTRLASIGDAWTTCLDTPRAIKRFGAQLRLLLPLHSPGEIDLVDLILLTLVRMYFPDAYDALPHHRARLIGRKATFSGSSPKDFDWTGIVDPCATGPDSVTLREILKVVFPITQYPAGAEAERPRASHHEYFDRYFHQTVPEDDVSDHEVYAALDAAAVGDTAQLCSLLTTDVGGRIDTAISKLWSFSTADDSASKPSNVNLLAGVMELLPTLQGRTTSILNQQQRATRWASEILTRLESSVSEEEVAAALRKCVDLNVIVNVIWLASGDDETLPPAVIAFRSAIVTEVLDAFIADLALKDAAPLDHTSVTHASYLAQFGAAEATARIKTEVGESFNADDYAARFVTLSYTISENPVGHINDFATQSFQTLTTFDDDFFAEGEADYVDRDDISWPNRKAYARGRARRAGVPQ